MALGDTLKQVMSSAAYAAGYGVGKASKALKEAADNPATHNAVASVREAALRTADAAGALADRMGPTLRSFAEKAAPVLQQAADKAVVAVKDAVAQAEPALREGMARAQHAAARGTDVALAQRPDGDTAPDSSQSSDRSGWTYPDRSA